MSTLVQIRNVPDDVHRRLKMRAASEALTMSDYVLREVRKALDRPTREELFARLATRPVRRLRPSPTALLRRERERR
jgi:plasmid stability protein